MVVVTTANASKALVAPLHLSTYALSLNKKCVHGALCARVVQGPIQGRVKRAERENQLRPIPLRSTVGATSWRYFQDCKPRAKGYNSTPGVGYFGCQDALVLAGEGVWEGRVGRMSRDPPVQLPPELNSTPRGPLEVSVIALFALSWATL